MVRQRQLQRQQGFTLIEVMAVIVIMGILASVAIHRFDSLTSGAEHTALRTAIRELNVRETLVWTNIKLGSDVWVGDPVVWAQLDPNIDGGYEWSPGPSISGGTLHFRSQFVQLTRTQSTRSAAARWF